MAAADMDTGAEDAAAAARPNGRSGGSGEGGSRRGALWWPVPPLERVTAWATAVLGAHLVTLQPNEATQQVLFRLGPALPCVAQCQHKIVWVLCARCGLNLPYHVTASAWLRKSGHSDEAAFDDEGFDTVQVIRVHAD